MKVLLSSLDLILGGYYYCLFAQNSGPISHSLYSEILQEERHFQVQLPYSYEGDAFYINKKYPVLIVLDGDRLLPVVGQIVESLSGGSVEQVPEMIVVGVSNTDRNRDFRPPYGEEFEGDSTGPERFQRFLWEELLPLLQQDYRTTACPYLLGHSFAGLFVADSWVEQAGFCGYLAIDPSMGWANAGILAKAGLEEVLGLSNGGDLYLAQANNPFNPGIRQGENQLAMQALVEKLDSAEYTSYKHEFFPDEDHFSIPLIATYHGLRFLFRDYQFSLQQIGTADLEEVNLHYQQLREKTAGITPPAKLIHQVALFLHFNEQQSQQARHLLGWLLQFYPSALPIRDSLAQISAP